MTTGMLPEAEFVFLDELFNANSAILNNLLTVLNERIYRRGAEVHRLPVLSLFSASNHLPEDDALQALFDRFLLRCRVVGLGRDVLPQLLTAGWALEQETTAPALISAGDLRNWAGAFMPLAWRQSWKLTRKPLARFATWGFTFPTAAPLRLFDLLPPRLSYAIARWRRCRTFGFCATCGTGRNR